MEKEKHLCLCGCGKETEHCKNNNENKGYSKERYNIFIHGHQNKGKHWKVKDTSKYIGMKNALGKNHKVKDTSKMHHPAWNKGLHYKIYNTLNMKGDKSGRRNRFKIGHKFNIGKQYRKGQHNSNITKQKMRTSAFEYAKKISDIICPRIGNNEKQILDILEQEINYKILRQYKCEGYFIDGYIPELNLAIEVDERPKNKERDIERENIIKNKLNCKFLRIKDYD